MGCVLQRLFSTFPSGWPGFGLLLLRLSLSVALIYFAYTDLPGRLSEPVAFAPSLIAGAAATFLLAGLWTPIMGTLVALDEAWIAVSYHPRAPEQVWIRIFLVVLSLSVAMLGPGAWSTDARLFGRKRFDIDQNGVRNPPSKEL